MYIKRPLILGLVAIALVVIWMRSTKDVVTSPDTRAIPATKSKKTSHIQTPKTRNKTIEKSVNKDEIQYLLKDCETKNKQEALIEHIKLISPKSESVFTNRHFKNSKGEIFRYRTFVDQVKRQIFYKED
jgi:hypothetical protein